MNAESIKAKLYARCLELVENRISISLQALSDAQSSANEESKSTAGDKHDTSRAMMQLEVEKLGKQLHESEKLKDELQRISLSSSSENCTSGSLVYCTSGIYFLSVAAGKIELNDEIYYTVSMSSPIGQLLKGHKKEDVIFFNGKKIVIQKVE